MDFKTILKANIKHKKGALISIAILMMFISAALCTILTVSVNASVAYENASSRVPENDISYWVTSVNVTPELLSNLETNEKVKSFSVSNGLEAANILVNGEENNDYTYIAMPYSGHELFSSSGKELTGTREIKDGEIYLPYILKNSISCDIGDKITLCFSMDISREFTIAGFVEEPFVGGLMTGMKTIFLSQQDIDSLIATLKDKIPPAAEGEEPAYDHTCSLINITVDDSISIAQARKEISRETGIGDAAFISLTAEQSEYYTNLFILIINGILAVFIIILFVVVLVVSGHSIGTGIEMDYVNLGILKSQGFTTRKLMIILSAQYLLFSLVGGCLGAVLCFPLITLINNIYLNITGLLTPATLAVLPCLLALIGVLVVLGLFTLMKTRRIGKITPLRAISGATSGEEKSARLVLPVRKTRLDLRMAVRQITTSLKSYAGTVFIVALLSFFLISVTILKITFGGSLDKIYEMTGDISADLCVGGEENEFEIFEKEISAISPITDSISRGSVYAFLDDTEYHLRYFSDCTKLKSVIDGNVPLTDNEIMLTQFVAEDLGKSIGDTITVSYKGKYAEFTVCGIFQSTLDAGMTSLITSDGFSKLHESEIIYRYYWLEDEEKCDEIVEFLTAKYGEDDSFYCANWHDYGESTSIITSAVNAITYCVFFIALIFIFVIVTMLCSRNFLRERHDLGVYKALGFTTKRLRLQFAIRFMLVAAVGSLIGAAANIALNDKFIVLLLKNVGFSTFDTNYNIINLGLPCVFVTLVFGAFSYFASRKIRKADVRELITE